MTSNADGASVRPQTRRQSRANVSSLHVLAPVARGELTVTPYAR